MIVAVLGATGNIGKALIPLLIEESNIKEIRILTNRSNCVEMSYHSKIAVTSGDYTVDKGNILSVLDGCNKVFVALPQSLSSNDMIERGKFIVDCALEACVPTMVRISSLGIDGKSSKFICSQGPLGDAHVAVEGYCHDRGLKQLVSLRPTSFEPRFQFGRNKESLQDFNAVGPWSKSKLGILRGYSKGRRKSSGCRRLG